MPDKQALLNAIETAYQHQREFVAQLPEAERAEVGTPERWSARDMLAHTAVWTTRRVDNFEAIARGDIPIAYDDYQRENDAIFATYRDMPWDDIARMVDAAHTRVVAFLQPLPEAALLSTDLTANPDRPLWEALANNRVLHVMLHLMDYHIEHERPAIAHALGQRFYEFGAALDESPAWQGYLHYDLACIDALTGHPDSAVTHLGEALRMRPDLVDWSKTDSDLDSLRDRADYQALYP